MTSDIEHLQIQANGISFHVAVSGHARPMIAWKGLLWKMTQPDRFTRMRGVQYEYRKSHSSKHKLRIYFD